jgi:alanine racemase
VKPEIWLDANALRRNARAWRERAGGAAVRAVVKSDGYGWGFATIVRSIDDSVEGYYVSDADEFESVRDLTDRPIATLAAVAPLRIGSLLERGGIPTLATLAGVRTAAAWARAAGKRARVRLALRSAIGWAGIDPGEVPSFAAALGGADLDVEFSSHVTDPSLRGEQTRVFDAALRRLRAARVAVVANDLASSAPLAQRRERRRSHVRLGVALFGVRFGSRVAAASAIRVRAPLVEVHPARGQRTGYGTHRAPHAGFIAMVRCGFGDGFPRVRDERNGILAVGMQFTTLRCREAPQSDIEVMGESTDLDALASLAGISVHQLVVGLGLASRAISPAQSYEDRVDVPQRVYAAERGA